MTIWKYSLKITDLQQFEMPKGATVLSAGLDPQGDLCVWAMVKPGFEVALRHFAIVGTGNPMPGNIRQFVGSVTMPPFVWHVFEVEVTPL